MSKENIKSVESPALYELIDDCKRLMELGFSEDEREAFEDTLEGIIGSIDKKADGYCAVISRFAGNISVIDAEIERLQARKQVIDNSIKRMKERLKEALEVTGRKEIKTDLHTIKIKGNGGKQPMKVDEIRVPDNYKRIVMETDKEKIRKALEAGEVLSFARLEDRGTHIEIK